MRKLLVVALAVMLAAIGAFGQQSAPTLRIVTEAPNLPSDLFYGDVRVRPLRVRPGTNTPITIDDADFFVQQHYVDFLSRFPDEGGFNFWVNEINVCNQNPDAQARANCITDKRTNVSAAYFLSIEFQGTGYLVYRLYRASFPASQARPRGLPRYAEFMADTRQIGSGVTVGVGSWQTTLENNKQAFARAWVQRAEFLANFPTSMTGEQFVDKLFQTAGVTPTAAERSAALAAYGSGGDEGRARAVRSVAESQTFSTQEFNKAFVLMQYFGYLRRNPNDAPDTDFGGYDFWLGKLNEFNGDFVRAQMVLAFISSGEYRDRF